MSGASGAEGRAEDAAGTGFSGEALERFAELAALLEEEHDADPEAFIARYPALREELRRLHARWIRLDHALGSLLLAPEEASRLGREIAEDYGRAEAQRVLAGIRARARERYERLEEIGRGGMGVVHRAHDRLLRRDVALKVLRRRAGPALTLRLLRRFLAEAEITAGLQHPGIVPVHDVGVDEEGRAFFVMPLREGVALSDVLPLARRELGDWSLPRVVSVLLRVCDALAYAHARGVLHRDLKPSNVLVGRFGEVYLLDWGLARRTDGTEPDAWPLAGAAGQNAGGASRGEPPLTIAGEVLGTPSYMAPEQAREGARSGRAADVYALGAVLYELLSGQRPYDRVSSGSSSARETLRAVADGPPEPLSRIAPDAPAELVAVCGKAMERRAERRYASVDALAADLHAWLEGRVVRAYRTGPWTELRKWIARNRALSAAVAAVVALLLTGLLVAARLREGEQRRVQRVADLTTVNDLVLEADSLWPPGPEREPAMESWLARVRAVAARRSDRASVLERMRRDALPYDEEQRRRDRESHPRRKELEELFVQREVLAAGLPELAPRAAVRGDHTGSPEERLARLEREIAALEREVGRRRTWRFADEHEQSEHDALTRLDAGLARLARVEQDVRGRLALAREIGRRSLVEARAAWEEAARAVAADPRYGGLALTPQVGLVPVGPDPATGLQEFCDLASGDPAGRDEEGRLCLEPETGIVLVLVPGGAFDMGAVPPTPGHRAGPNVDRDAIRSEGPVTRVQLDPFFLSKFETTQAQWWRLSRRRPSYFTPTSTFGLRITPLHPVESVSWDEASEVLRRYGLALPTEAQWEFAARAGTTTPTWAGPIEALIGLENVKDHAVRSADFESSPPADWDGFVAHAPVQSLTPNPWGFHHMLGNVTEWAADEFVVDQRWPREPGTGLRRVPQSFGTVVMRGGSFAMSLRGARASRRDDLPPSKIGRTIGVRAARLLRP